MTYSTANPPLIISEPLGSGPTVWQYASTDSAASISATGYFTNGAYLGMAAGDVLFLVNSTSGAVVTTSVLLVAGGAATIGIASPSVLNAPAIVAQSYAGWTRSSNGVSGDDVYGILQTVTIPGGLMGLNSKISVISEWEYSSSTNTKVMGLNFGATEIAAPSIATLGYKSASLLTDIINLNSLASQKTSNAITYSLTNNARITTSINTANDSVLSFKCKWGAAGVAAETITLLGYSVWHYPGA